MRIKVSEKVWKFCGQCSNNILTVWEHLFLKNPPMRFIRGADSIYMKDIDGIRKRFPNRLLEIEMIRRLKPHSLVKQIKKIQIENEYNIDFDLDSLVNEMEKQQKL